MRNIYAAKDCLYTRIYYWQVKGRPMVLRLACLLQKLIPNSENYIASVMVQKPKMDVNNIIQQFANRA